MQDNDKYCAEVDFLHPNFNFIVYFSVCGSIDVRNSVENLGRIGNCTIIDGYLQILLIDRGKWEMYENYSFPNLREINNYFFLYRVSGLQSLRKLFPNLAVIRGRELFHNYAFVIYEMFDLREIGLKSLTQISRGGLRFDKNPALCFVNTIDWKIILSSPDDKTFKQNNFISEKQILDMCPTCSEDCDGRCWTTQDCQISMCLTLTA